MKRTAIALCAFALPVLPILFCSCDRQPATGKTPLVRQEPAAGLMDSFARLPAPGLPLTGDSGYLSRIAILPIEDSLSPENAAFIPGKPLPDTQGKFFRLAPNRYYVAFARPKSGLLTTAIVRVLPDGAQHFEMLDPGFAPLSSCLRPWTALTHKAGSFIVHRPCGRMSYTRAEFFHFIDPERLTAGAALALPENAWNDNGQPFQELQGTVQVSDTLLTAHYRFRGDSRWTGPPYQRVAWQPDTSLEQTVRYRIRETKALLLDTAAMRMVRRYGPVY